MLIFDERTDLTLKKNISITPIKRDRKILEGALNGIDFISVFSTPKIMIEIHTRMNIWREVEAVAISETAHYRLITLVGSVAAGR